MIKRFHNSSILPRRKQVLAKLLAEAIGKQGISVLDVGCGDGEISREVSRLVGASEVHGVETYLRPTCHIPVSLYNGNLLPFPDNSFDCVVLCDVLHHDPNPQIVLNECRRVAREMVVIKDHLCDSPLAHIKLRFMDWGGNSHHNVHLEYNYLSRTEWNVLFEECQLSEVYRKEDVRIYFGILQKVFGMGLHFVTRLILKV